MLLHWFFFQRWKEYIWFVCISLFASDDNQFALKKSVKIHVEYSTKQSIHVCISFCFGNMVFRHYTIFHFNEKCKTELYEIVISQCSYGQVIMSDVFLNYLMIIKLLWLIANRRKNGLYNDWKVCRLEEVTAEMLFTNNIYLVFCSI